MASKTQSPPKYAYNEATETHTLTYPDGTRLEATRVALDHFERLNGDVTAYAGENILNRGYGDLLHDGWRRQFCDTCNSLDGAVAWLPRLVAFADQVAQTVVGTAQSAREYWTGTATVPEFLRLDLGSQGNSLVRDLVYPGCITILAAPRGLGKSNVAIVLGLALAQGGRFRDETLTPARVSILDRDNPPFLVQERLRNWGGDAAWNCHVRTRDEVPPLTDRTKWKALPAQAYDVLILDSLLSATEGVTERESKQYTQVIALLKDLAHRGPGILVLHNVVKSGEAYRGRGELADAIDVLYELRDATGWVPDQEGSWWEQLPDAGEAHWASRATRHQEAQCIRLAFVVSKFRLGLFPAPFILELDMTDPTAWSLREVTEQVVHEGKQSAQAAAKVERDKMERAVVALQAEVAKRATAGAQMSKSTAETFLKNYQISRKQARNLIDSHLGTH